MNTLNYNVPRATYPLRPEAVIRSHSWPFYNLSELALDEKKGLTYGTFKTGLWLYGSQFVSPDDVNNGSVKIKWAQNPNVSPFHGAIDTTPKDQVTGIPVMAPLEGIIKKVIIPESNRPTGHVSVWLESIFKDYTITFVMQHLDTENLPKAGTKVSTGQHIGNIGHLLISGKNYSHLHFECISKSLIPLDYNFVLYCNSKTGLRSQFNYNILESVGITGDHYMYNGLALINFINNN